MKKLTAVLLAAIMLPLTLTTLTGCDNRERGNGLNIVCTIFPQYDWVRQILGETADDNTLTLLVNSGVDFHSYEPTVRDIITISEADLFIYVGGHSDKWVESALENKRNADMIVINLVEAMGEAVSMVEHICDPDCEDTHGEEELIEEEHVWTSLLFAQKLTEIIAEAIIRLDPDNEDLYRTNTAAYIAMLAALHDRYSEMAESAGGNTLVFGDRFPFLYLANDYGLNFYAAFDGCSASAGISEGTMRRLAGRINYYNLNYILILEDEQQRGIAQQIIGATRHKNQQILVIDSIQSVTLTDISRGYTYLSAMESNLEVLRKALG
jgi:zinc transport system substrate-binding protein